MQELWVWSLGWEDPLEKQMATYSNIPGKSHGRKNLEGYNAWGCKRIGHYLATKQQQQQNTEKRTFIKKRKFRSIPLYLARGNNRDNMWLFPGSSDSKESACKCRRPGSVPGLGRPPGGGNGNPFQYSGLENSMDRRTWRATVHGLAESDMTERPTLSTFRDNVILWTFKT